MIKQAPTAGRIFAMVAFSLSCFGIVLFLWLQFGGPVPLKAEGYRVKVALDFRGVPKGTRDNYILWEEGKGPDVVIELTSSSTHQEDIEGKFRLYRDVLKHYGAVALPCQVQDPDRKGKVESGVGHAQKTPLKGLRFESLQEAQTYLDRWEERWANTRIHGTTKRQVAAMFGSACSGASRRSTASGASVVSASIAMQYGVSTSSSARFWAPAFDPVFSSGQITSAPAKRASSPVASVDWSSTTMIRAGGVVCSSTLRTVSDTDAASL